MAAAAKTLVKMQDLTRDLYLFDTFEGMTEPTTVPATALPVLEPPKRKPNRLMMEVDTAIGPQERKPRRVPSPAST